MIYQTEKTLTELGDKVTEEEKSGIVAEVDKLKELIKTDDFDTEAVKTQLDAVTQKFYGISQKLYEQAQQAQQAAGENPTGGDDNVVDAEYTVVDDENK